MPDRRSEWNVPKFGPERFRVAVGLLFLPYAGMVLSYTVIGSMVAEKIYWTRVLAIMTIYFLALAIGANALDAIGSKMKPWGNIFSKRELLTAAVLSLTAAYGIGIYYMVYYTPLLWIIAILEGFFLLAYNLEWFGGRFHTDEWFVLSWGVLPVLAGYVLQTNSLSLSVFVLALGAGFLSSVEITAERAYKKLKQLPAQTPYQLGQITRYERILKCISFGTMMMGIGFALFRWIQ